MQDSSALNHTAAQPEYPGTENMPKSHLIKYNPVLRLLFIYQANNSTFFSAINTVHFSFFIEDEMNPETGTRDD